MNLAVYEIFRSIQGETTSAGFPSLFVRLTGCNLRCRYCDTARAWAGGSALSLDAVIETVLAAAGVHHITITGGEPLLQTGAIALMDALIAYNRRVQLETNGSISIAEVPAGVVKILDVKTPGSGHAGSFLMENLDRIAPHDELKFVITDRPDYEYSRDFIEKNLEKIPGTINFSPVSGMLQPAVLAEWILADCLPVRLNVQLHALLWPRGEPGTV